MGEDFPARGAACLETAGFCGRPGSARASSWEGEQLTEGRLAPVGPERTLEVQQGLAHGDDDGGHPQECFLPVGRGAKRSARIVPSDLHTGLLQSFLQA